MFFSLAPRKRWPAILPLAAALIAAGCAQTGKSRTYASLLDTGTTREIREKLAGTIRSNAEIIRELERRPASGWLRFVAVGDSVSRRNRPYKELLAAIATLDPPPAFVVNLGDFTRGRPEHYSYYIDTIKGYRLPIIHLMGNHEAQYPADMIFRSVLGERDFFFDYGGLRFIFMGSEPLGFSRPRLDWLEDKLKGDVPATKIFVSHEYMFEAYTEVLRGIYLRFVERIANTDKVLELLDLYRVPLAVAGHLHRYYEKTFRGTVMIMSGGGGQSALFEPRAKEPLSTKEKHFTVFDVPAGHGQPFRVAVSAMDRRGALLFPTSFYQWSAAGNTGQPGMRPMPPEDLENDTTLPRYVRDLYERSSLRTPADPPSASRTGPPSGRGRRGGLS